MYMCTCIFRYMELYILYIYISNCKTVCMHIYTYTCVCMCMCILAKEGSSKNNINRADTRIRVKCFHSRGMKVRSSVYPK